MMLTPLCILSNNPILFSFHYADIRSFFLLTGEYHYPRYLENVKNCLVESKVQGPRVITKLETPNMLQYTRG